MVLHRYETEYGLKTPFNTKKAFPKQSGKRGGGFLASLEQFFQRLSSQGDDDDEQFGERRYGGWKVIKNEFPLD